MFITLSIFLFKEIIKIIIGRHIYGIIKIETEEEEKRDLVVVVFEYNFARRNRLNVIDFHS
jgi:hypothetical protein